MTGLRLTHDAAKLDHLDVATVTGKTFTIKPKFVVIAAGAMENARLLFASNDVVPAGAGNGNDLVGRFFADHAIPRDCATMVIFDGKLTTYYPNNTTERGAILRGGVFSHRRLPARKKIVASLTTVENEVKLDELGRQRWQRLRRRSASMPATRKRSPWVRSGAFAQPGAQARAERTARRAWDAAA
ncbi:MAG: hypothetical protein WDM89_09805 [Rhizomicrobium sp.]